MFQLVITTVPLLDRGSTINGTNAPQPRPLPIRTKGVFFQELAQNFQLFRSGGEAFKLRLYVGHDGSMVRLASGLGFGKIAPLRWPALGSEIAFEVRTLYYTTVNSIDLLLVPISVNMGIKAHAPYPLGLAIKQRSLRPCDARGNACLWVGMDPFRYLYSVARGTGSRRHFQRL